jgi:hypothetical protein
MDLLTPELEAACLRALRAAWGSLNHGRFRGALRPPTLELSPASSRLGRWEPTSRTLQLSRALVLEGAWGQVIEVLKHEMAHQYVWEVLGERHETPHGPTFQALCERLGIDGAASGAPAADGGEPDRIVERVRKLLALAGSPNEHEARAAMAAAQRLMLKHNLEVAGRAGARYGFRHLGKPSGRIPEPERILAGLLGEHFFVEGIWVPVWRPLEGRRGLVLEVCGTPENLELAAHVHGFMLGTADRLWRDWRRAHRAPLRDRRAFQSGVMAGFRETLSRQAERNRAEALIWVGDADLRRYHRRRHPHIRSSSYTVSPRTTANEAGRAAGRTVVLHRPIERRGEPGAGGRHLGPRSGTGG